MDCILIKTLYSIVPLFHYSMIEAKIHALKKLSSHLFVEIPRSIFNTRFPMLQHYAKAQGGLAFKETVWKVFALGNVKYLKKYRRPQTADLWIGSMLVSQEDYECSVIFNQKNILGTLTIWWVMPQISQIKNYIIMIVMSSSLSYFQILSPQIRLINF